MFEHLDDHNPGRTGTSAQLAAVRNRAREINRDRRRSHLAVGSVTLTAAASVSGVAVLTGAGPLHHLEGQAAGGGSGSTARPTAPGHEPALVKHDAGGPGMGAGVPAGKAPLASVAPSGKPGTAAPGDGRGTCAASTDSAAASTAPAGYTPGYDAKSQPEGSPYSRTDGADAKIWVKVTCSGIALDDRTSTADRSYTPMMIAGRSGYLWHAGADEAGVEWTAADGTSVYIKATGASGVRMSDAELEAFAASLPAT